MVFKAAVSLYSVNKVFFKPRCRNYLYVCRCVYCIILPETFFLVPGNLCSICSPFVYGPIPPRAVHRTSPVCTATLGSMASAVQLEIYLAFSGVLRIFLLLFPMRFSFLLCIVSISDMT